MAAVAEFEAALQAMDQKPADRDVNIDSLRRIDRKLADKGTLPDFVNCDPVGTLLTAIERHILSEPVVEIACALLVILSDAPEHSVVTTNNIATANGIPTLIILGQHDIARHSPQITCYVLRILANMTIRPEHLRTLVSNNLIGVIFHALKTHTVNSDVAEVGLRAITAMSYTEETQLALVHAGALTLISDVLQQHGTPRIAAEACRALTNLSICHDSWGPAAEARVPELLVAALNRFPTESVVVGRGLQALANVCCLPANRDSAGAAGALPLVVDVLRRARDVQQVHVALFALSNLVNANTRNQTLLRESGGVQTVVQCMGGYPRRDDVQALCGKVLAIVTVSSAAILREFVDVGGIPTLLNAMSDNVHSVDLQRHYTAVLVNVSAQPEWHRALGEAGAVAQLLQTVQQHVQDRAVAVRCMYSLGNITAYPNNRVHLAQEEGGVRTVCSVLAAHRDEVDIVLRCHVVLAHLASADRDIRQRTIRMGAVAACLDVLDHLPHSAEVQSAYYGILVNLSAAAETFHPFVEQGVLPVVLNTCKEHFDNDVLVPKALKLLGNVTSRGLTEQMRAALSEEDALQTLIAVMSRHVENEHVQLICCWVLQLVSNESGSVEGSTPVAQLLARNHLVSAVTPLIEQHLRTPDLIRHALELLVNCSEDPTAASALRRDGAIPRVVAMMVEHSSHALIQELSCMFLANVAADHGAAVIQDGAVRPVVEACHRFADKPDVFYEGIRCLENIAHSQRGDWSFGVEAGVVTLLAAVVANNGLRDTALNLTCFGGLLALSEHAVFRPVLYEAGVAPLCLETVVKRNYQALDVEDVANDLVSAAICTVANLTASVTELCQRLIAESQGMTVVLRALQANLASPNVAADGLSIIANVAAVDDTARAFLGRSQAVHLVLCAMREHPAFYEIQQWGCMALGSLSRLVVQEGGRDQRPNAEQVVHHYGVGAILNACGHQDGPADALSIMRGFALGSLSFVGDHVRRMIAEHGGVAAIEWAANEGIGVLTDEQRAFAVKARRLYSHFASELEEIEATAAAKLLAEEDDEWQRLMADEGISYRSAHALYEEQVASQQKLAAEEVLAAAEKLRMAEAESAARLEELSRAQAEAQEKADVAEAMVDEVQRAANEERAHLEAQHTSALNEYAAKVAALEQQLQDARGHASGPGSGPGEMSAAGVQTEVTTIHIAQMMSANKSLYEQNEQMQQRVQTIEAATLAAEDRHTQLLGALREKDEEAEALRGDVRAFEDELEARAPVDRVCQTILSTVDIEAIEAKGTSLGEETTRVAAEQARLDALAEKTWQQKQEVEAMRLQVEGYQQQWTSVEAWQDAVRAREEEVRHEAAAVAEERAKVQQQVEECSNILKHHGHAAVREERIKEQEADCARREAALAALQEQLTKREKDLTAKLEADGSLDERDRRLRRREDEADRLDKELRRRTDAVEELEVLWNARDRDLTEKETCVRMLNESFVEREEALAAAMEQIVSREAKALEYLDESKRLRAQAEDRVASIYDRERAVVDKESELEVLKELISEGEADLKEKQALMREREDDIAEREAELVLREQAIMDKEVDIVRRERLVTERELETERREIEQARREVEVERRERDLDQNEMQYEQRDVDLTQRERDVGLREQAVLDEQLQLTRRDRALSDRETAASAQLQDAQDRHVAAERTLKQATEFEKQVQARSVAVQGELNTVDSLRGEIERREGGLRMLRDEVRAREQEVESREKAVGEAEAAAERKVSDISTREARLQSLEGSIGERERALSAREGEVEQRTVRADERDADLNRRAANVTKRDQTVSAKEREIANRERGLLQWIEEMTRRERTLEQHEESLIPTTGAVSDGIGGAAGGVRGGGARSAKLDPRNYNAYLMSTQLNRAKDVYIQSKDRSVRQKKGADFAASAKARSRDFAGDVALMRDLGELDAYVKQKAREFRRLIGRCVLFRDEMTSLTPAEEDQLMQEKRVMAMSELDVLREVQDMDDWIKGESAVLTQLGACPIEKAADYRTGADLLDAAGAWWKVMKQHTIRRAQELLVTRRRRLESALSIFEARRSELPHLFVRQKDIAEGGGGGADEFMIATLFGTSTAPPKRKAGKGAAVMEPAVDAAPGGSVPPSVVEPPPAAESVGQAAASAAASVAPSEVSASGRPEGSVAARSEASRASRAEGSVADRSEASRATRSDARGGDGSVAEGRGSVASMPASARTGKSERSKSEVSRSEASPSDARSEAKSEPEAASPNSTASGDGDAE